MVRLLWCVLEGTVLEGPFLDDSVYSQTITRHSVPPVDVTLGDLYALSFPRVPE
jgi:hypothetical protein